MTLMADSINMDEILRQVAVAVGVTNPSEAQTAQWQQWAGDALLLIKARLGDLSALDQDALAYVVREAVVSMHKKPDDATTVDVSVDDGRVSRTYASSRGRVFILDEWWKLLAPDAEQGKAFHIDTAPRGCGPHRPWCALNFLANYCSCGADLTDYEYPLYEDGYTP